jgi:hypothetical protein
MPVINEPPHVHEIAGFVGLRVYLHALDKANNSLTKYTEI